MLTTLINNATETIHFQDKLYGREDHLKELNAIYKASAKKESGLVLVKGVSGMGKSAFVNTFASNVRSTEVYFVKGKQDLSRNNQPYASIIQAFSQLIEEWVNDSQEKKAAVAEALNKELGIHNQIILKAFPRLSKLLQIEVNLEDNPRLAFKDRFNEALLSFTSALSFLDQRIIIFLDDLQWADLSTMQFLKLWLSEGKASNLFWIGAYREDEVSGENWLADTNFSIGGNGENVSHIKLTGLTLEVIQDMVRDILIMKDDRLKEFSELVLQLTGGNPLFVREALPFLCEDGVLYFRPDSNEWDYEVSKTKTFNQSSRTLEFIIRKMELFTDEAKELLGIGSAIGNKFNAAILSAVTEKPHSEINELLAPCLDRRMIEPVHNLNQSTLTNQYRFVHDKVQNAAYSMLSEDKKEWVHYSIGKTYSSSLGYAAQDRNIYDIVNQFNQCISYFTTEKERLNLVEMNLKAGKKAKLSSSFDQALGYFNIVIHLIETHRQDWNAQVIFEVYLESGEAAYLKSDFVSGVMFYESALKYAQTDLQKARVHHNFLVMYNGVSDMNAAWESGIKVLKLLHVNFPKNVGKATVLTQFSKIKWLLRGVDPKSILDRPEMVDPEAEQLLLTLMEMIAAAWGKKPELLGYIVLKGFEIVLKNGNTPIGYFAVSGYGAILGMAFGKVEKGWEFVKLGGALTEKYDSMVFHGRGLFGVHGTYSHLIFHSRKNIVPLSNAFDFSKGAGDYSIAAYSSIILLENMVTVGLPVDTLREKASSFHNFLKRTSNYDYLSAQKSVVVACDVLQQGIEPLQSKIEGIDKRMERVSFHHVKYTWYLYKLFTFLVLGIKDKHAEIVNQIEVDGYGALSSIEMLRLLVLSMANADLAIEGNLKNKRLKFLRSQLKEAKKNAALNPANYAQLLALCKALIAQINGNNTAAVSAFKAAIESANKFEFLHFEALFCERLAQLYQKMGDEKASKEYMKRAKEGYLNWGAHFKVENMSI